MKVLVLDDMDTRHKWFMTALIGNEYHPVYTSGEAIEELKKHRFDMIFLDHDLEEKHYTASFEGVTLEAMERTGYDVAKWIVDNNYSRLSQIIVHSLNFGGSKRMVALLAANGYNVSYVSFLDLQRRLINHER